MKSENASTVGKPNTNFTREEYRTPELAKRQQLQNSAVTISQATGSPIVATVRRKKATKFDSDYTENFSCDAPAATSTPVKEDNNQRYTSAFISTTKNIEHHSRSTKDHPQRKKITIADPNLFVIPNGDKPSTK